MYKVSEFAHEIVSPAKSYKGLTLSAIESILDDVGEAHTVVGETPERTFKDVESINYATADQISFCPSVGVEASNTISRTNAGVVLCKKEIEAFMSANKMKPNQVLIFVDNPSLASIHIMRRIYSTNRENGTARSLGFDPLTYDPSEPGNED